ncbi:hypothetical protein PspLS_00270 [Pyricularia sp. CBS 133598]|nr:hypothetical protein PspLS_00270 [Pyricularia sp. CBS 133598]
MLLPKSVLGSPRALRYIALTGLFIVSVYYLLLKGSPSISRLSFTSVGGQSRPKHAGDGAIKNDKHPISRLMRDADETFQRMLSKQSYTLEAAAAMYRERRGRHPPPGFDVWWNFASQHKAVMVEDFFDQIYVDLDPFLGLPPAQLRKQANESEQVIEIKNGKAISTSDFFWTKIWFEMLQKIEQYLPDMHVAFNGMDEPRLVTPWEEIDKYMAEGSKARTLFDPKEAVRNFSKPTATWESEDLPITDAKYWERGAPFWEIARRGCPPDTKARTAPVMRDYDHDPVIEPSHAEPHLYQGFVSNYTLSTSICHQPDLQGLHGAFIEPVSIKSTRQLFPWFGGSKLNVNNDILVPPPMYWSDDERFTAKGQVPWAQKKDGAFWRGTASGGRVKETNWKGFHRHRFIAMNNGTTVESAEKAAPPHAQTSSNSTVEPQPVAAGFNFALPDKRYNLKSQQAGKMGEWIGQWANMAFTDINCFPKQEDGLCRYTDHAFKKVDGVPLSANFDYKFLPDIDGNSFSGRYLSFLRSRSLPVKATIFREWHDSRLVAWKHFVPVDSRFGDYHAVMEYFLGFGDNSGHDAEAEKIAFEGRDWAEKALRREDMLIYLLRLLLEYARVVDDSREKLGFVDDLLPIQSAL